MEQLCADSETRAIVVTGAGLNFSAGADLRELESSDGDPALARRRLTIIHDLLLQIASGPKPVLAAVEGAAFGAGLSLAAACDVLVAGESARFGAAFVKIGLAPDCGLLWSLPQRVGVNRAKNLLLTGRAIDAQEALGMGLADEIVAEGTALETAVMRAGAFTHGAPLSIAAIRRGFAEMPAPLVDVLARELDRQPLLLMTDDHRAARSAFFERRKPVFKGR